MTALFKKRTLKSKEDVPQAAPVVVQPVELKSLLKWEALARPYKKRDREFYTTIAAIVFLLAVILLFLQEWLLIVVLASFMFVTYVLATVQPEKVEHEITTLGVTTSGKSYKWQDFLRFWFEEKTGETILHIDTMLRFPTRLILLLGQEDKERVKKILQKYVRYENPEDTFMDKASKWLQEKVPLESK